MAWAKRIGLFLAVNILVVAVISFLLYFFNIQPYLTRNGLNIGSLAVFCLLWGMIGSFISLALSKVIAKWTMGLQMIDPQTRDPQALQVLQMVHQLSKKAGLPAMPEVGIYESPEVNAFATGPSKSNALVAVSRGLLKRMPSSEVEAVLGHEVTHIANGDMVTMTLLQGIVNAFVMFLARIIAFGLSKVLSSRRDDSEESFSPLTFQILVFVFEMIFMVLGSMVIASFSRYREYRADAGGARLTSPEKMIASLKTLQRTLDMQDREVAKPAFQALKISNPGGILRLFASHPPLEDRIARLEKRMARTSR
jgi:heat shock protein HtpX